MKGKMESVEELRKESDENIGKIGKKWWIWRVGRKGSGGRQVYAGKEKGKDIGEWTEETVTWIPESLLLVTGTVKRASTAR